MAGNTDRPEYVTKSGRVLTESDLYELQQEAEAGYDPDKLVAAVDRYRETDPAGHADYLAELGQIERELDEPVIEEGE